MVVPYHAINDHMMELHNKSTMRGWLPKRHPHVCNAIGHVKIYHSIYSHEVRSGTAESDVKMIFRLTKNSSRKIFNIGHMLKILATFLIENLQKQILMWI